MLVCGPLPEKRSVQKALPIGLPVTLVRLRYHQITDTPGEVFKKGLMEQHAPDWLPIAKTADY